MIILKTGLGEISLIPLAAKKGIENPDSPLIFFSKLTTMVMSFAPICHATEKQVLPYLFSGMPL